MQFLQVSCCCLTAEHAHARNDGRMKSAEAAAVGSQLFVHGGRNNFVLEDLFVLDLAKKEWTDVPAGAHTPPPRHGHLMTVQADKLYMYGGYDELGAWSDAMFCLPVPYGQPFTAARYPTCTTPTSTPSSSLFVV